MPLPSALDFSSAMALKTGSTFSLTSPTPHHSSSLPSPSVTFLFKFKPTSFKCLLCSPTPIFLPLLEQDQSKDQDEKTINIEKEIVLENEDEDEDEDEDEELDPIRAFFKFRSQTQKDPKQEGRLSLKRNRRTTWHLAESESHPLQKIPSFDDAGDELCQLASDGVGSESVVEEILKISRNLPKNLTLGDYLGSFVGKVSKDECVEALIRLGQEGLIWSCLYLFEWMGLQEPLLTTPRACVVIFTVLAEGGMGEKVMVLFDNLPRATEFRDVRIYNAAISGLAANKSSSSAEQSPNVGDKSISTKCSQVLDPVREEEILMDTVHMPLSWHESITGVGQTFENVKSLRMTISNFAIAKNFVYKFVKNDLQRLTVECDKKESMNCKWRLHASPFKQGYDDAWRVYGALETDNIMPDHVTCCILITAMRKSGRCVKDAWELLDRMNRKGVNLSVEVFGALIKSFCDEGLKKEALIIQSEMEKKGIPSNTIIYNTLMNAYAKSNQVEEAEGIFVEMKEKGFEPTLATYNILMDAYSRRMQPETVEDLLSEMQESGLKPNVKSYTCLISSYGRKKKMSDMAADAFLRMKKAGIKPTAHSYTALIHAYSIDGWHEKAYITYAAMKREGIKPSIETYTTLLDGFRRAGEADKLMEIWKLMTNDGVEGTRVTYNIILDGLAKQGLYVQARDVIYEFGRVGLQATVMTYNMLMNAYARGGQHYKLPQLMKEMSAVNLKPDSFTYSTVIYAYVRVRDFAKAFYYHKQMVRSGQVPDAKSYSKLRAILEEKAATKNRRDRSAILGIVSSKMGIKREKGKKDEFWKSRKRQSGMNRVTA